MTKYELGSIIVGAIAIIGTIILAVWRKRIRHFFREAPKLKITLEEPAFNTTTSGQDGWYYLICISNKNPHYPAENARLLLTNVHKKAADGSWREHRFSGPTQVKWRWPNNTPQSVTIGAQDQTATFAALMDGKSFKAEHSLDLRLYNRPNNLNRYIHPEKPVRLTFQAVSESEKSDPLTIEVAWNGDFHTGSREIAGSCIVKPVPKNKLHRLLRRRASPEK